MKKFQKIFKSNLFYAGTIFIAVLFACQSVFAQTPPITPIVKLDCGPDNINYPLCGSDGAGGSYEGVAWTRSSVLNAGPAGEDVIQVDHIGVSDTGLEYYHGRNVWNNVESPVPQGASRYVRIKVKILPPIDWQDDAEGRFGFKWIKVGSDGANDTHRFFANLRSSTTGDGTVLFRAEKNVDGSPSRVDYANFPADQWVSLQCRLQSSSTDTAQDGYIYCWINNNDFLSPTIQSSGGFSWDTSTWANVVAWGFYGESLGVGHHASYQIAAFEYDDEFDQNWYATGSSLPPTPKQGDLNNDTFVDISDYNIFVSNFGRTGSGIVGDIDLNNAVNIFDYNLLVGNFGR